MSEANPFTEDVIMRIIFDIASGLKHLHSQTCPIICRNLEVILLITTKAETVYFAYDGNHKIGRLGLGYYFTSEFLSKKDLYTFMKELQYWTKPSYIPPELAADNTCPVITLAMDIWSLGVILGELMNIGNLVNPPLSYSKKLQDLQAIMLNLRPQRRPTADQVLNYILQMVPKEVNAVTQNVV